MTDELEDEWAEGLKRFGDRHPIPKPPPIVKQRLRQVFERYHGRAEAPVHQIARPVFDSRDNPVPAGVRGPAEVSGHYQRSFASDTHGVLLDVELAGDDKAHLEGQVIGIESVATVWEAQVVHSSGSLTDIGGDENGSFSIADAPRDVHLLRLTNGELIIEVHDPLGESGV